MNLVRNMQGGPEMIEELFVRYDSGPGEERFIILSSRFSLDFLSSASKWFLDGTFSIVPSLFYQLLSIHGQYQETHHTIPSIFILLSGKTEDIYRRAFR